MEPDHRGERDSSDAAERRGGPPAAAKRLESQRQKGRKARVAEAMRPFTEYITSPQSRLIIRNAVQTLLEAGLHSPSPANVSSLLSDDDFRAHIVRELVAETPEIWSEEPEPTSKMGSDSLLSRAKGKVATRASLIRFWSEEWEELPSEARLSAAVAARRA